MVEKMVDKKVAIVTGAASGIGKAAALLLNRERYHLVLADRQALDETLRLIVETGGTADTVVGDITDSETIATILKTAGNRVDLLANIAGILDAYFPADEVEDDLWELCFNVNVNAAFRLVRGVLPLMVKAKRGSIVNVASVAGVSGNGGGAAYVSSKHALVGLTRSVSMMYRSDGIRSNAVAPGPVLSGMTESFSIDSERARSVMKDYFPTLPPTASPDDIAEAIVWLASDKALNVNGADLACDGGWSAM